MKMFQPDRGGNRVRPDSLYVSCKEGGPVSFHPFPEVGHHGLASG